MQSPTYPDPSLQSGAEYQRDLVTLIHYLRAFASALYHHRDLGDLAEDLAPDTLAKAWRARGQFRADTNLKAWLSTVSRNEFYSHRQRARRETHWDRVKGDCIEAPPDLQVRASELSDTARAFGVLPDSQREGLPLIVAAGFSYEGAAEICKAPVGTIKSRVARGRVARGRVAFVKHLDGPQNRRRCRSVDQEGGTNDILAQRSVLMPAGATSTAHA